MNTLIKSVALGIILATTGAVSAATTSQARDLGKEFRTGFNPEGTVKSDSFRTGVDLGGQAKPDSFRTGVDLDGN